MAQKPGEASWQNRLLPLMVVILVGLAIFFCAATLYQLHFLQTQVLQPPVAAADSLLVTSTQAMYAPADAVALSSLTWSTMAAMEAGVVARRYHLAHVTLASRLWARYLGFITGMTLALVGAAFILGKIKEAQSQVDVSGPVLGKLAITSSSPGLILATLGTALMMATILTNPEIKVKDSAVYLGGVQYESAGGNSSTGRPATSSGIDSLIQKMKIRQQAEETPDSSDPGGEE